MEKKKVTIKDLLKIAELVYGKKLQATADTPIRKQKKNKKNNNTPED